MCHFYEKNIIHRFFLKCCNFNSQKSFRKVLELIETENIFSFKFQCEMVSINIFIDINKDPTGKNNPYNLHFLSYSMK